MTNIYSLDGITITEGVQDMFLIQTAKEIASDRGKKVIANDGDTSWVVGPRGGVMKMTRKMMLEFGFNA